MMGFLKYGEGGIRTLGTALRTVQQISNLPLSTTQPPLQAAPRYKVLYRAVYVYQRSAIVAKLFGKCHPPKNFHD